MPNFNLLLMYSFEVVVDCRVRYLKSIENENNISKLNAPMKNIGQKAVRCIELSKLGGIRIYKEKKENWLNTEL